MPAFRVGLESASDRVLRSLLLQLVKGPIVYLVTVLWDASPLPLLKRRKS